MSPIPDSDIKELAEYYDQFANALDPLDPATTQAEKKLMAKLQTLHLPYASKVSYHDFRKFAIGECIKYLKKN